MLKRFYPKETSHSVYDIDFETYYKEGYRSILFDIDNTLVPHGKPADEKIIELFEKIREIGFQTVLISNNDEYRVAPFAKAVGSKAIWKAKKPKATNYLKAIEMADGTIPTTLFVGDQVFTDIYGGNQCGLHTILLDIIHPKEEIQIVIKRYFEKIVLHFYRKSLK